MVNFVDWCALEQQPYWWQRQRGSMIPMNHLTDTGREFLKHANWLMGTKHLRINAAVKARRCTFRWMLPTPLKDEFCETDLAILADYCEDTYGNRPKVISELTAVRGGAVLPPEESETVIQLLEKDGRHIAAELVRQAMNPSSDVSVMERSYRNKWSIHLDVRLAFFE